MGEKTRNRTEQEQQKGLFYSWHGRIFLTVFIETIYHQEEREVYSHVIKNGGRCPEDPMLLLYKGCLS